MRNTDMINILDEIDSRVDTTKNKIEDINDRKYFKEAQKKHQNIIKCKIFSGLQNNIQWSDKFAITVPK
jgi:hypothetical protein